MILWYELFLVPEDSIYGRHYVPDIKKIVKDCELKQNRVTKDSKTVENAMEQLYYRLNIPQERGE